MKSVGPKTPGYRPPTLFWISGAHSGGDMTPCILVKVPNCIPEDRILLYR